MSAKKLMVAGVLGAIVMITATTQTATAAVYRRPVYHRPYYGAYWHRPYYYGGVTVAVPGPTVYEYPVVTPVPAPVVTPYCPTGVSVGVPSVNFRIR